TRRGRSAPAPAGVRRAGTVPIVPWPGRAFRPAGAKWRAVTRASGRAANWTEFLFSRHTDDPYTDRLGAWREVCGIAHRAFRSRQWRLPAQPWPVSVGHGDHAHGR